MIAAAALLASCAKVIDTEVGNDVLSFDSQVSVTKGELKEAVSTFNVKGYGSDGQWFPESGEQTVTIGSGASFPTFIWDKGVSHTFYAYANLPSVADAASASITADGVTLTYSAVPASAAAQTDILLGKYIGTGDKGKAKLTFDHALTSVKFVAGSLNNVTVTGLSLSGVYTSGSVTLGSSGLGTWQDCTASGQKMTGNLGDCFILIPQNLANNSVQLTLEATIGLEKVQLVKNLDSDNWQAGKTNVYTINYDGGNELVLTSMVESWESIEDLTTKVIEGALPGVFTVGAGTDGIEGTADDKKVFFSKGNLQYRATADGTGSDLTHKTADGTKQGIWRFAEEQWHTVGNGDAYFGNVYETIGGTSQLCTNMTGWNTTDEEARRKYAGWIDMFPECSSGYVVNPWDCVYRDNYYGPGPYYSMMNHKCHGYDATAGTNWEWGYYNAISNGGENPGIWRTPLKGEFDYLLITRKTTSLTIGNKNNVNAVGTIIENIPGIMIFPDNFTWPMGLQNRFTENDIIESFSNGGTLSYHTYCNDFTISYMAFEFLQLEQKGVIFLPICALWTMQDMVNGTLPSVHGPVYGYYWESSNASYIETVSHTTSDLSFINFQFVGSFQGNTGYERYWWGPSPNVPYRNYFMSVRLVTDAN